MRAAICFLVFAFAFDVSADSPKSPAQAPARLYLHFFAPLVKNGDQVTRFPSRIVSTEVRLSEPIHISIGSDTFTLRGLVEARGKGFHAQLEGTLAPTTGMFNGDVELERPVVPSIIAFSGAILPMAFVLSTNPECDRFLAEPLK